MVFSPPVVGCLVKRLAEGGVTSTPGPPWLRPCKCKVPIQEVKTVYTCAICGVNTCPETCFKRYDIIGLLRSHDDNRYNGSRRLKEGGVRPFQRDRRR